MPIKSYLLHCEENNKDTLLKSLEGLKGCEVIPAKEHNVVIVVTDTATDELDKELHNQLLETEGLKHMSLVSGFDPK